MYTSILECKNQRVTLRVSWNQLWNFGDAESLANLLLQDESYSLVTHLDIGEANIRSDGAAHIANVLKHHSKDSRD
jgi:hypothetical protein